MTNEEQITLWEAKIKELVAYANWLQDNPESPLQEYFDICGRIDRLQFGIKHLKKGAAQ